MFWKDKKARQAIEQLRQTLGFHDTNWNGTFEPFEDDELTHIKDIKNELTKRDTKLNLILSHLNLIYIPESEKKEPARLEEKPIEVKIAQTLSTKTLTWPSSFVLGTEAELTTTVKKKRKYTKRKKSKK